MPRDNIFVTTLLVSIGIVIAFAVLFWLDKKQGPEPTRAIVHLFDLLRNLDWDMSEEDIKNTFSEFRKTTAARLNRKTTLSHKYNVEGQEIYTTFTFPNVRDAKVSKAEIKLSRTNKKEIDQLFSTVSKQYGQPVQNDSIFPGSVKWTTEPGVLTLENTAPEEYVLTVKEEKIEAPPE